MLKCIYHLYTCKFNFSIFHNHVMICVISNTFTYNKEAFMYDNFLFRAKQTVYKWWCVVYRPVYKLVHHGYWPNEKEPYVRFPDPVSQPQDAEKQKLAAAMADQILETNRQNQHNIDDIVQEAKLHNPPTSTDSREALSASAPTGAQDALSDLDSSEIPAGVDDDVLARANEIMARLNREAAEDEAKKQQEIDKAKELAAEQQRVSQILKANERNIDVFIQEGLSKQHDESK